MANYYNTTLRNLEYRLRKFEEYLPELLEKVIREKEDVIIRTITEGQLYRRGIDGRGEKLADYHPYRPSTIARKLKKGQPTSRVTLRDTGEFYEGFHLISDKGGFYITSGSDTTPFLVAKYGPEIFRLTDKNLTRILRSHIRKALTKYIRQIAKKQ